MKKTSLLLICALIALLVCLASVGCSQQERISSISLKGYDPNTAIEIPIGVFDYSAYTVEVTYNTGRTEEVPLTEEMIVEADVLKIYREGTHDIGMLYGGVGFTFRISVKRGTFGELRFPENNVFVYDGKAHSVEVEGDVPANAIVTYPEGNTFVNAGTYDVRAVVTCEGYVTQTLSTTVKVERANYDMSGIRFTSKEVVYNGKPHTIAISGTVPEGVSAPTYYVDENKTSSAVDAGTYKIKAVFETQNSNYNVIPPMEATLKILPAQLDLSAVDLIFKLPGSTLSDTRPTLVNLPRAAFVLGILDSMISCTALQNRRFPPNKDY